MSAKGCAGQIVPYALGIGYAASCTRQFDARRMPQPYPSLSLALGEPEPMHRPQKGRDRWSWEVLAHANLSTT
jgi:hypothetical protein